MTASTSPETVADLSPEDVVPGKAVTLLQRVLMPRPADPRKVRTLYLDEERSERVRVDDRATGHLTAGDEVPFATYFNAFPAASWRPRALPRPLSRRVLAALGLAVQRGAAAPAVRGRADRRLPVQGRRHDRAHRRHP